MTVLLRAYSRRGALWAALAGLGLAVFYVLSAYFSAPPSSAPWPGCSDCGVYLGRWWEPYFVLFIVGWGFAVWLLGVGAGAVLAAGLAAIRRRRSGVVMSTPKGGERC